MFLTGFWINKKQSSFFKTTALLERHHNVCSLFGLYCYENLRKVRTNAIGINPFKWRKYVLFRKLRKVIKYAWGFSILYFRNVSIVIVN